MGIERVLTAVLGALALILLLSGLVSRARRASTWTGALAAGAAAFAAYHGVFWAMVVLAMVALTCAFVAIEVVDLSWRLRFSIATSIAGLGLLALWPTLPYCAWRRAATDS